MHNIIMRLRNKIIAWMYKKDIQAAARCPEAYASFLYFVEKADPDMVEEVRELIHAQM